MAARLNPYLTFHGNADLAAWRVPWAEEAARRTGWLIMLAEYRGYGGLSGEPTVRDAMRDARAAGQLARSYASDSLGTTHLALYGHSLGSAIATELAAELPVDYAPGLTRPVAIDLDAVLVVAPLVHFAVAVGVEESP